MDGRASAQTALTLSRTGKIHICYYIIITSFVDRLIMFCVMYSTNVCVYIEFQLSQEQGTRSR